ncbi:hypothetical protein [Leadbettera azotonutricia]|uniref:Uncharacterized protein n=1 Tax=Leadbettera azotonutricia (strain ATCC BAA-888 / DSM 13862 / ZAS-9) TaxID=545695 RepID=F5YAQ5_LEAAZ|nr:hypothetical protein [Leadbettera azotonutricia]AEF83458.1 hypothetical protein TREAZ_1949 [Leadbettera azotonutricia ZAS-9]
MRSKDPEARYHELVRKQRKTLEEYAAHEIEWADDLLMWYRLKKIDMPDDEYRAVAFFKNHEYLRKPGSLTLCYTLYQQCMRELPEYAKELAFDLLAFRYHVYGRALMKGGT